MIWGYVKVTLVTPDSRLEARMLVHRPKRGRGTRENRDPNHHPDQHSPLPKKVIARRKEYAKAIRFPPRPRLILLNV